MLEGIDPILSGELLLHLDNMGHSDTVVVADAHFPARRLATRFIDLPGLGTPEVVHAIRTVLPLDDHPSLHVMTTPEKEVLPIHRLLADATGAQSDTIAFVERFAFYDLAADAYLILRTGETRVYANMALRKGIVRP